MSNKAKIREYLMDNIDTGSFDNVEEKFVGGAKRNHLVLERNNDSYLIVINAPNNYPGGLERFKEFSRIVFNKGYKMLQVFSEEDFPELSETKNADYFRTGGRVRADEVRRLKGVAKVCAQNEIPLNFVNPNQGSIKVYNFGEIFSYATHRSVRGQLIEIPEGRRKTYLKDKMEPHLIEDLRGMLDLESEITDRRLVIGKFKLWQPRAPRLVENISGNQLSIF